MSLGLDDLRRRSSAKKVASKPEEKIREEFRAKLPIKPWSNRGLAKAGVSRKLAIGIDSHVNEDWIEIQDQIFFWLNLNFDFNILHEDTDLKLQRTLLAFERKLLGSADKVKNFVRFIGLSSRHFNIV